MCISLLYIAAPQRTQVYFGEKYVSVTANRIYESFKKSGYLKILFIFCVDWIRFLAKPNA